MLLKHHRKLSKCYEQTSQIATTSILNSKASIMSLEEGILPSKQVSRNSTQLIHVKFLGKTVNLKIV